jgi:hypothetical protein
MERRRCDLRSGAKPGRDQSVHDRRLGWVRRLRLTGAAPRTTRRRGPRRGQNRHRKGVTTPLASARVVIACTCRVRVGIARYPGIQNCCVCTTARDECLVRTCPHWRDSVIPYRRYSVIPYGISQPHFYNCGGPQGLLFGPLGWSGERAIPGVTCELCSRWPCGYELVPRVSNGRLTCGGWARGDRPPTTRDGHRCARSHDGGAEGSSARIEF